MISHYSITPAYRVFKAEAEALMARNVGMAFHEATAILQTTRPELQQACDDQSKHRVFIEPAPPWGSAPPTAKQFSEEGTAFQRIETIASDGSPVSNITPR